MTSHGVQLHLPDTEATEQAGAVLAHAWQQAGMPTVVVYLDGDLGAGKSTLARALLRALGVSGAIRSPTYTLVERYPLQTGGEALHIDLYRIGDAGELEFLGLDDADARLWLVEWPQRGRGALPAADLELGLAVEGRGRSLRLHPASVAGQALAAAVQTSGRLQPVSSVT